MPGPETIIIRTMRESDLNAVLTIEHASFSVSWRREHFQHELGASHSFPFVAEVDGTVAGYVCLQSLFEEAQILDIAVNPHQRGQGLARTLMEHAFTIAQMHGAEFMALEVRESNFPAIILYERLGFIRTGVRQGYYEGKEDAVLMEKNLRGDS